LEALIGLLILVVLVIGGFFVFNQLRGSSTGQRAARVARSRIDDAKKTRLREPTVETLQPGDAVAFGDGSHSLVESVLDCREQVGARTSTWRWSFLDDGKLLESAPDGNVLYERSDVAYQGDETFHRLVAEAEEGGVLKLFEHRVRAGQTTSSSIMFEHADLVFHIRSTGTFSARAMGKPLGEVWRDIGPEASENVYFEAEAPTGEQLLGVWTTHVVLLVGQKLGITDIEAIYPGAEGQA
jgi:hypothetical protein